MERSGTPKRRKIRKGTQSCWECKRRKIRCTFNAPTEAICDGCRSRQTRCISQEFCEERIPISKEVNRLNQAEDSFEQPHKRNINGEGDTQTAQIYSQEPPRRAGSDNGNRREVLSPRPLPLTDVNLERQATSSIDQISAALTALWPSQHDLDIILSVPVGVSVLYHGVVCIPYSTFFAKQIPPPQNELQLPPPGSHPVIIARKLLMLSTFLQAIPPCFTEKLVKLTCNHRILMSSIVDIVGRLVTSNDELVNSLEGIECIMVESMYRNNGGNLRRAWLTNRRAMAISQMMGLDAGNIAILPSMVLEEDTRSRIDPNHMWFRLVCSDRYLSLVLGLPQCSVENVFATPKALKGCTPLERLERLESFAGGLILQRNSAERPNLAATQRIDKVLQEAGALMSPQWWMMTPDLAVLASNTAKAFEETTRLTYQFTHNNLLVQLHLPYMLQPPSTYPDYEYNKMTATNASRTILTQFLHFRGSTSFVSYCRGIDFIVFIASTTLCLAHIEARRQKRLVAGGGLTPFQTLQHQRQSDRGLLECVLDTMKTMTQMNKDPVASEIARILQPLLDIESDSAKGQYYQTSASLGTGKHEPKGSICMEEVQNLLRIHIPHFGTIKIERHHLPQSNEQAWSLSGERLEPVSQIGRMNPPIMMGSEAVMQNRMQNLPHQRGDHSDNYYQSDQEELDAGRPKDIDWQAVLSNFEPACLPHQSQTEYTGQNHSTLDTTSCTQNIDFLADFDHSIEEWPLQNVDTALFNSLLQGCVNSSEGG
ncbi:uncharacterized protein A1O9_07304 [Exophiala aquamarina CBS 119918]|uniref:Zn(2)-C6 fungal-type domain-containing protein n=1 Tax=Exophiala aquamarina CBS 119918 TaxID=1182545 RepID=A0A072PAH3_9EURO|nr:uncharacterized protein A1O9_07304 [Exophiala aquamarina CBS 119918]KEF57114.1 hypothetical protein A1O9_07304 [Exophiala aquamarina CBS 119918]